MENEAILLLEMKKILSASGLDVLPELYTLMSAFALSEGYEYNLDIHNKLLNRLY
jgi:hypothetical protein